MGAGRRPPTAPGAKAPTGPSVRPKKLYRDDAKNRDEKPAGGVKAAAKQAAAKQGEGVSREGLRAAASAAGLTATGKAVPIAQLSRKELQVR